MIRSKSINKSYGVLKSIISPQRKQVKTSRNSVVKSHATQLEPLGMLKEKNSTNREVDIEIDQVLNRLNSPSNRGLKLNPPGARDSEMLSNWLGMMLLKVIASSTYKFV